MLIALNVHFYASIRTEQLEVGDSTKDASLASSAAVEQVSSAAFARPIPQNEGQSKTIAPKPVIEEEIFPADEKEGEELQQQQQQLKKMEKKEAIVDDGLESQYAEVEWVRGIQERRKLGLEPSDEDPYAHVPDQQLQPFSSSTSLYHFGGAQVSAQKSSSRLEALPSSLSSSSRRSLLDGFAYLWPQPLVKEMHFVHVPKYGERKRDSLERDMEELGGCDS
jgi:hypothetical protein